MRLRGWLGLGLALCVSAGSLTLAGAPDAPQPTAPTIAGSYTCHGEDAGKPYRLELEVTRDGDAYRLAWGASVFAAQSSPSVIGLGVVAGDALAAAMVTSQGGVGAAIYRVQPGKLDGRWTKGDGVVLSEVCSQGVPA